MKDYYSIARKPKEIIRQNYFHKRFIHSIGNPPKSDNINKEELTKESLIPEWQLVDFVPESPLKPEESVQYVTDWEM